jgi:hypothetical protein
MTSATRTAPKSGAASFRDFHDRAVGIADGSGRDPGIGGGRKTERQRAAQEN